LAAITTVLAILIALLAWAFPRQPETATAMVPGVTGLSEAKAIALLASKGFEAVPSFVLADGHSVGHVRAESPSAGTETAPSSAVAIEISQSAPPSAKVPPVAGLTEDQAVPLLLAKGFAVSTSYVKPDMQHSSGLVAAESPLGGSQAVPHSVVTIDVANSTPPFKYCKKLTTVG
jgi:serine/threonine-protein kinase